jgi:hypothetical protein
MITRVYLNVEHRNCPKTVSIFIGVIAVAVAARYCCRVWVPRNNMREV